MYVLARNQQEFIKNFSNKLDYSIYNSIFKNNVQFVKQFQLSYVNKYLKQLKYNLESKNPFLIETIFLLISSMFTASESWETIFYFRIKNVVILQQYLPLNPEIFCNVNDINQTVNNICLLLAITDNKRFDYFIRTSIQNLMPILNDYYFNKKLFEEEIDKFNKFVLRYINIDDNFKVNSTIKNSSRRQFIANNMLIIRQIALEIIKKYKVKRSAKLGINVIRRMAFNNQELLNNIIKHWMTDLNLFE